MRVSLYHVPFFKLERNGCIWILGYNTRTNQFVKYSTTNGPGMFQSFDTVEELYALYRWFTSKGWTTTYKDVDNIKRYA